MKKLTLLLAGFVLAATAFVGSAEAKPGRHDVRHQPPRSHAQRHPCSVPPRRTLVRHYAAPVRYSPAPVPVYAPPVVYYDNVDPYWGFGFNSSGDVHFNFGW